MKNEKKKNGKIVIVNNITNIDNTKKNKRTNIDLRSTTQEAKDRKI